VAILHPDHDELGKPVFINHPSTPTEIEAWADPTAIATVVPGGQMPTKLNGVALTRSAPTGKSASTTTRPRAWPCHCCCHPGCSIWPCRPP